MRANWGSWSGVAGLPGKGNPQIHVRLDAVLKRFLTGYAVAHDTSTGELVRGVLAEWVRERVYYTSDSRVSSTLQMLDMLARSLQLWVMGGSLGVQSAGAVADAPKPKPPRIDIQSEREAAYRIVISLLKEANRLAGDEALAKQAEARMTAMLVASNLTRTGEAILRGYEKGYLQPLVDELVNLIEQLKEQLEEARMERQESTPASTTP